MKTLRYPQALLALTAFAGLCSVPAARAVEPLTIRGRDMAIVAHQDDDLLFMNPDIMHAIQANHAMLTVFLTAGDAGLPPSYWAGQREPGSRAAYATMAGVTASDASWTPIYPALPFTYSVKIDQMIRPNGKAPIYLAFVRLPATYESGQSADPSAIFPGAWDSLRMLWMGQILEMDELVDPNASADPTNYPGLPYRGVYEKGDLLNTLVALMKWFQPEIVRAQDGTGLALNTYGPNPDLNAFDPRIGNCSPGCSTNPVDFTNPAYVSHFGPQDTLGLDPSVRAVWYTGFGNGNTGEYYNYDHSDHYFSALFARTAIKGYAAETGIHPKFEIYRGYNVTFLAPNVTGLNYTEKQAIFDVYGTHDTTVGSSGYYDPTGHYISWISRQYGSTVVP